MQADRILAEGPSSLCDAELLRLLLGARDQRLPASLLSFGLSALRRLTAGDLRLSGASDRESAQLLAAIELGRRVAFAPSAERPRLLHAQDLARVVWPRLSHLLHEEFWTIVMNARLQEIRSVRISLGGLTQCSVTAREAFAPALLLRAPVVAFVHNHPSGDAMPSPEDLRLQLLLDEAGRALGLRVLDHLVVGDRTVHSSVEGECPLPELG
jgi:DNA repair protein RadC